MGAAAAPCCRVGVPAKQPITYGNASVTWYRYEPLGIRLPLHASSEPAAPPTYAYALHEFDVGSPVRWYPLFHRPPGFE